MNYDAPTKSKQSDGVESVMFLSLDCLNFTFLQVLSSSAVLSIEKLVTLRQRLHPPKDSPNNKSMTSFPSWKRIACAMFVNLAFSMSTKKGFVLGFTTHSSFLATRNARMACTRHYSSTRLSMKLQTAIVGLPNVGKVS